MRNTYKHVTDLPLSLGAVVASFWRLLSSRTGDAGGPNPLWLNDEMGVLNPSFLLGFVVLLYLASFIVFAVLRIATGISIQRIGYFSLRRIAYTPREGIRIDIRGLGAHLHRPTFAQPTWISLRLEELRVTLDVKALAASRAKRDPSAIGADAKEPLSSPISSPRKNILHSEAPGGSRGHAWKRLTGVKEKLKQLHEKIHWLCLVDVFARNAALVVTHIGRIELGTVTMLVDTRRKTVDRGRMFQHKKVPAGTQKPAEWMLTIRGILFTPEGKESLEIIDIATLNVHGLLYRDLPGLRDSSIALKLGRLHIPYDDFMSCNAAIRNIWDNVNQSPVESESDGVTWADVVEELDRPGSREANIVQTVSDSKEFVSSILRGIQEIQMAVSFMGMTKSLHPTKASNTPLYLSVSMNEVGIDMHRLDANSPAHRMYFSSRDVAHQALIAAISISVSLDDGHDKPERLLYIPMATTTMKTTLPSKTVAFTEDKNAAERNANILFANFVLTSPSIDLDPKHMPLVLALIHDREGENMQGSPAKVRSHHLLSRLLPKASVKMSVHEPVIRVTLPPSDPMLKESDDYDLLICAVSSISLDTESSHSAAGDLHYALVSTLRLASHHFYYQTAVGERYNLLSTEALELKAQLTATPEICVIMSGNIQTLSVHLVRPEISTGVRQIVQQLSSKNISKDAASPDSSYKDPDFLRPLPGWLVQFNIQGSNFSVEIAGVDPDVSLDTRGFALHMESWTAEYKLKKAASEERPPSRRHLTSKPAMTKEPSIIVTPPSDHGKATIESTDGRRLAIHLRAFEGFIIEGIDVFEQEAFLALPRFEVAFTTSSDTEGSIFHVNSFIKALYVQYSLYRSYSLGVAAAVLRKAFAYERKFKATQGISTDEVANAQATQPQETHRAKNGRELVTVDMKAELLQLKARFPSDPPLMLQIFNLEAGQHRWAKPFLRSRLLRLFAETPQMPSTWSRILTTKTLRVDLREIKRKRAGVVMEEKSFDVATDVIRLAVPHQLIVHKISDNVVNVMKASAQLYHRFKFGADQRIPQKKPEQPKKLPRIALRSRAILLDIEDGPFDWKLGMIYRVGLLEQKQRIAREAAYRAKVKHLEKHLHRGSSRYHDESHNQQRYDSHRSKSEGARGRSQSSGGSKRHQSESPRGRHSRRMRYDPGGKCALSKEAKVSIHEGWQRLQKHDAQSWKKRIDGAYQLANRNMREIRSIFWKDDEMPQDDGTERVLAMPERPGLMSTLISDLHIVIDKPSFPINHYPDFLHRVGKGMPRDMEYSLLVPMNIQIDMGEARVTLRDYPLPLLHVPTIRPGQSPRLPSWSLRTDLIIAEEHRGELSSRQVQVEVVAPDKITSPDRAGGFALDVLRTVSPVKTYSDVNVAINTNAPTSITWGTSLQPAIQEMMMVIEAFTKPQADPSDRTGFWDKIRLTAHSRVSVTWTGDGDVHLNLKGNTDYMKALW